MTICDPTNSLCVNHRARGQSGSLPALQLLYNNHVNTYEKICDKHDLKFIPLAFDTLGRMHPDSAKALHNVFINHRLDSKGAAPLAQRPLALGGTGVPCLCVHSGATCLPGSGMRNAPLYQCAPRCCCLVAAAILFTCKS